MSSKSESLVIRKARTLGLKFFGFLALAALFLTEPSWPVRAETHLLLERLGILLLAAGVLGRLWCTLYIAGKKSKALVTTGPYALCRHPLYLFSLLLVTGTLLILQHAVAAAAFGLAFLLFHALAMRVEEAHLARIFGAEYANYCRTTPRLLPHPGGLRRAFDRQSLHPSRRHLGRIVLDSTGFLLVFPVAELLEGAYRTGLLPIW